MHKLLADFFLKNKIKPEELHDDEKQVLDQWQSILEKEVTVETILEFCQRQRTLIENKWKDRYRDRTNDTFLADTHAIYSNLVSLITATKAERAQLEKRLEELLDATEDESV